jgi:hypothetical protein
MSFYFSHSHVFCVNCLLDSDAEAAPRARAPARKRQTISDEEDDDGVAMSDGDDARPPPKASTKAAEAATLNSAKVLVIKADGVAPVALTDAKIAFEIEAVLRARWDQVEQLSTKMVRETLEKKLGVDMLDKKEFIKSTVESLMAKLEDEDANGGVCRTMEDKADRKAGAPKKQLLNRMPLLVSRASRSGTCLLQLEDTELDVSGDIGAIGRLKVENFDLTFDIKGSVYRGDIMPTTTLLLVGIGPTSAKVEGGMCIIFHFCPSHYLLV